MAGETKVEAENSDFNLSPESMSTVVQELQETQTVIPTVTAPETLMSPTHVLARMEKSLAGSPARVAVQTLEAAATETCEPRCTALGTCPSQSFPSQNKPFPQVDLALQVACTGITAEGKII